MASVDKLIDLNQPSLWWTLGAITFNPTFWNIVAQAEYNSHFLTKIFFGKAYAACNFLALTIFSLGIYRDGLYREALKHQPNSPLLDFAEIKIASAALFTIGMSFVLTSTWKLGITGTFLGDYFGILMDNMVTSFPFNLVSDPMYVGSTLNFVALALWSGKPAGLFISAYVGIVYYIATSKFEGPFTRQIYARREHRRQKGKGKSH